MSSEEEEEENKSESVIYDTVLIRDTCGNSRSKLKNFFYHKVYEPKNFKYVSNYGELVLLDYLEGTKTKTEYIKTLLPFIIIMCLGGLSIILWIFLCYCYKSPKGCLKRYSKSNKTTRDSCFFIFFGFCSFILILIIVTMVYLTYAKSDINSAICSLSMLRYEIVYGQSLLERKSFKKPFWYGIDSLSENIQSVRELINTLHDNCENDIIISLQKNDEGKNDFDNLGNDLKDGLEELYNTYKDEKITDANGEDNSDTIPLYISKLGFKENNETYTGKVLQDYETHYEYLIKKITDPILDICNDFITESEDLSELEELPSALDSFNEVISTLEDSMDLVALYVTKKISDQLVNLQNIYYVFYLIFLGLMGVSIISITILFFIYYYKPISAMNYSIKLVLYFINFLMIFCIVLSGLSGILYKLFSDSSDIVDCMYSSKNLGSNDPRIIQRATPNSVLNRCVRGDGNLLEEYLTDNGRKIILNLKKINTIYLKIVDAYNKITSPERNEYNTLSSLEQLIDDFTLMQRDFSLTTSREECGTGDINYMLNELNRYTLSGMGYQTICETSTYHLYSLIQNEGVIAQIDQEQENYNGKEIEYKYIIDQTRNPVSNPVNDYASACALDEETNHFYSTSSNGVEKYFNALQKYYGQNQEILEKIIDKDKMNSVKGLTQMLEDFTPFIGGMQEVITAIKTEIADPFWEVFGKLVNDTTDYSGVEDAEKVDILGWVNCSFLGQDYNMTMNSFKELLIPDLKVVMYCSLIFEVLTIALYFIIVSLANNIRDKEMEKQENGYDIESIKEDGGEIFEIIENNKYKKNYETEGELITINKIKQKPKKSYHISTTESKGNLNIRTERTNDISKEEDINSIKKNLPDNIIQVPKFDIAENIEAIKNVDVRKLIDKNGRAVMHPIRISINSPLGVMEASDKYAHLYNYDIFEPLNEDELNDGESDIENGSYYQKNGKKSKKGKSNKKLGKVKKGKKGKKGDKDKGSNQSSSFSF